MSSDRKYKEIISFPTLDGIVATGLLRRIFPVEKVAFKIHPSKIIFDILVGVPITANMIAKNCFIIDIIKCERFWSSSRLSNIFLCDDDYGSLTDFIVATFDTEIPEDILDAIFELATLNFESGSMADKFALANLVLTTTEKLKLVDLATKGMWDKFKVYVNSVVNNKLAKEVLKKRDYLREKAIRYRKILFVNAPHGDLINNLATRAAAVLLATKEPIVFALTPVKNFLIVHGYSNTYNLIYLAENLEKLGIASVARPHYIRARVINKNYLNELIDKLEYLARRLPEA